MKDVMGIIYTGEKDSFLRCSAPLPPFPWRAATA